MGGAERSARVSVGVQMSVEVVLVVAILQRAGQTTSIRRVLPGAR
jgi:hypothetical protein